MTWKCANQLTSDWLIYWSSYHCSSFCISTKSECFRWNITWRHWTRGDGDDGLTVTFGVCALSSVFPFIETFSSLTLSLVPPLAALWGWMLSGGVLIGCRSQRRTYVHQSQLPVACASQWGHVERRRIKGELNLSSHHHTGNNKAD